MWYLMVSVLRGAGGEQIRTKFPHATTLWIFSKSGVFVHTPTMHLATNEL